jgi:hypothetical protein
MIRTLYCALLRLHPRDFRLAFADEMLCIFDEAGNICGATSLLRDAGVSVLRQVLLRSGLWKWVAAGIAGLVPVIIAFGSFLPWDRPFHP